MLNSITLDNKKVTNWISTGISPVKITPFDTCLIMIMSNFANDRVSIKFKKSVLMQRNSSLLYS